MDAYTVVALAILAILAGMAFGKLLSRLSGLQDRQDAYRGCNCDYDEYGRCKRCGDLSPEQQDIAESHKPKR